MDDGEGCDGKLASPLHGKNGGKLVNGPVGADLILRPGKKGTFRLV